MAASQAAAMASGVRFGKVGKAAAHAHRIQARPAEARCRDPANAGTWWFDIIDDDDRTN